MQNKISSASWRKVVFPDMTTAALRENELPTFQNEITKNEMREVTKDVQNLLSPDARVLDMVFLDLDTESREELLMLLGDFDQEFGDRLVVVRYTDRGSPEVWTEIDLGELKPWKVDGGDVDDDGKNEVVIGVYKKARFDPKLDNRLFVYEWEDGDLFPKWLGSSLSLPFYDFAVGDLDGERGDELVSLERFQDGGSRVMVYEWSGFGFQGDRYWNSPDSIESLILLDSNDDGKENIFIEL